ncbi:MAG: hypothetical protein R6X27_12745 [Candidatus Desulfacyla sp.]
MTAERRPKALSKWGLLYMGKTPWKTEQTTKLKEQKIMMKKHAKAKSPPAIKELVTAPHRDLMKYKEQKDAERHLFETWAFTTYKKLSGSIPKSYLIEKDAVLQNPEHILWREHVKSLKSNLEREIKRNKTAGSETSISPVMHKQLQDLYGNVLDLEAKSHV